MVQHGRAAGPRGPDDPVDDPVDDPADDPADDPSGEDVRVVAADGDPVMLGVLRSSLEEAGLDVVGEASSARAAVEAVVQERPDVAVLDLGVPGSGIAAAEEIGRRLPETAVVVLADPRSEADLFDALRAGARGFLPRGMDPHRLGRALRGVVRGEAALPRAVMTRVLEEFRGRSGRRVSLRRRRRAELTGREWDVMELLRTGLTTEEVADRLFLTPGTVRVHVSNVVRKLRAGDREGALAMLRDD